MSISLTTIPPVQAVGIYPAPGPVLTYNSGQGNTLIISGSVGNTTTMKSAGVTSITDSAGNYWRFSAVNCQCPPAAYDGLYDPSGATWAFTAWCINALPVEWVAIGDSTGNSDTWLVNLSEWAGINSVEGGAAAYIASGSNPGPTLTIGNAGDLVMGSLSSETGTPSGIPAGASEIASPGPWSGIYAYPGATGSYSFNWTASATDWVYSVTVFSPVVIPPPSQGPVYSGYQVG